MVGILFSISISLSSSNLFNWGGLCLSNSFNWVVFLMVISFVLFSFIFLLISGGRSSDLCRFSLVCSVVLGFSSVLVLVFTFVFI